jgi:hypothetical protein
MPPLLFLGVSSDVRGYPSASRSPETSLWHLLVPSAVRASYGDSLDEGGMVLSSCGDDLGTNTASKEFQARFRSHYGGRKNFHRMKELARCDQRKLGSSVMTNRRDPALTGTLAVMFSYWLYLSSECGSAG